MDHDLCFAGSGYGRFADREAQLRMLLDPLLDQDIHIFDRQYSYLLSDEFEFPELYRKHIMGCLSYDQMLSAYRRYKIFLNANSVVDSATMFSRRVFEILACGTNVVSAAHPGIAALLGESVVQVRSSSEVRERTLELLRNESLRRSLVRQGVHAIFEKHTSRDRLATIFESIGASRTAQARPAVAVSRVNREQLKDPAQREQLVLSSTHVLLDSEAPKSSLGEIETVARLMVKMGLQSTALTRNEELEFRVTKPSSQAPLLVDSRVFRADAERFDRVRAQEQAHFFWAGDGKSSS
jgi:hypothetical protein